MIKVYFTFLAIVIVALEGNLLKTQASPAQSDIPQSKMCTIEALVPNCTDHSKSNVDLRKYKSEADGVLFNYFIWGHGKHHQRLQKFGESSAKSDQARALKLAEEARKLSIKYVTGGRDKKLWSTETQRVVQRIELLEFQISDASSAHCMGSGDPGIPQAAYSEMDHTVGLCHSLVKTHSESIMATVLHEIGHAVSSCKMKKSLMRYKEITSDTFSCLTMASSGAGSGPDDDSQANGRGELARSVSDVKIGLDVSETNTSTLIDCDAAEFIPNSNLENVRANAQFDLCAKKAFSKDYEDYVAKFSLDRDSIPKVLTQNETELVEAFKLENPESCYRKAEEQYADAFASETLSIWLNSRRHRDADQLNSLRLAIYDLSEIYCVGKLENRNISDPYLYPSNETRLLTHLAPHKIQDHDCKKQILSICSLPADPASFTSPPLPKNEKQRTAN